MLLRPAVAASVSVVMLTAVLMPWSGAVAASPSPVVASPSPAPGAGTASPSPAPTVGRVFLIMMENHGYSDLIGDPSAPWLNAAAATYGLATQSFGVAHPSQPNYIAATSGSTFGVTDDSDVTLDVPNIVDQVEGSGRTWTAYMQSLAACNGDIMRSYCGGGLYGRKHDPFVSYQDVASNPERLTHIVDLTQLTSDLAAGTVADLVWISPDQCHDMHGLPGHGSACAPSHDQQRIATGDAFLSWTVGAIMASSAWTSGSLIFVTWDEAGGQDTAGCCSADPGGGHILTIVISHDDPGPRTSDVAYDHYSLLSSVQAVLHLGCLGSTCDVGSVRPMTDLIGSPAP